MYKNVKGEFGFVVPFYYLYCKSLEEASPPISWKEATITAIDNKGDIKFPNNYHPINLMSVFYRMLESIIRDNIMSFNNFFSKQPYGLRSKRSWKLNCCPLE